MEGVFNIDKSIFTPTLLFEFDHIQHLLQDRLVYARKGRVRISPLCAPILTFFLPSFRRYICTL